MLWMTSFVVQDKAFWFWLQKTNNHVHKLTHTKKDQKKRSILTWGGNEVGGGGATGPAASGKIEVGGWLWRGSCCCCCCWPPKGPPPARYRRPLYRLQLLTITNQGKYQTWIESADLHIYCRRKTSITYITLVKFCYSKCFFRWWVVNFEILAQS